MRKLVGDDFPLAFDANNRAIRSAPRSGSGGCSRISATCWFEEPVEYYHAKAMGEVAQRLDITVSAGEQSYTLQSVAALIESGVRMVQPDIVKMGGVTGLMQCAALCHAHGVEFVPTRRSPSIGNAANLHVLATACATKPAELADGWSRRRRHVRQRAESRTADAWSCRMEQGWASRSTERCCGAPPRRPQWLMSIVSV